MKSGARTVEWIFDSPVPHEQPPTMAEMPLPGGHMRFETVQTAHGVRAILADGHTGADPVNILAADESDLHEIGLIIPWETAFEVFIPGVDRPRTIRDGHWHWHMPAERWVDFRLPARSRIRTVGITLSNDLFERLSEGARLPTPVAAIGRRHAPDAFELHRHMDAALRPAVGQLFSSPYHGEIRRLSLEGRLLEVVSGAFESLTRDDSPGTHLSAWEVARVRDAAAGLLEHPASPPSVDELGRETGLGATRLMQAFKAHYGVPPVQWLQQRKLEMAHQLLADTPLGIKEIAFRLGYRHVSNFASAFKRHYGVTPGSLRRQR
ncbi:AraC family transcriptional regulator [Arhodomonas sp. KWT]|uniref:helix-turn-helix transcriptional regulator n=1 Tax=Arhodomonas sp. KWT TaxID=2679915 RepID=UPI0013D8C708|nr:helix-turn-helix domain-containing protein [Arhodomonas sp. KWT]